LHEAIRVLSVIESKNITKHFGKLHVLNGVSFTVDKGSIMGLIGPNGAGKTTTIKVLLGLLRAEEGEARVFGENPWNNPNVTTRIGVVQEKPRFPSNISVLEYLSRIARLFGFSASRANTVLKEVGLNYASSRKIGKLSAGMLQRFALAHSLINEPELVIADEPTSNLDPQARNEVLERIASVNRDRGTAFMISSHLLPELSRICNTASVMNGGKIIASGGLEELYKRFQARITRVSTSNAPILAEAIKGLDYVVRVDVSGENISVEAKEGQSSRLYEDVARLAKGVHAELNGIESKNASLEELFRRTTSPES
jgi:ABC-2 type transport system ATP-binding protein